MRHKLKIKKLSRDINQRKALFRGLLLSFFDHEKIETTVVKAKLVKKMADSLISKAGKKSLAVRRQLLAFLPDEKIVEKLIKDIAPRFEKKQGGYTKITRVGCRRGDNTMIARVELLEKPEKKPENKEIKNKKSKK